MTNPKWEIFEPTCNIKMPASCVSLIDDSNGLTLIYEDQFTESELSQKGLAVHFDDEAVLALRKARTTDFYNDIVKIEDIDNGWIFVTDNSSFIDWLTTNSHYTLKCKHYKFITEIEIIDVLSFRPPVIKVRDEE